MRATQVCGISITIKKENMKNKNIIYSISLLFFSIILASCSEKIEDNIEPKYNKDGSSAVRLNIETLAADNDLAYTLHLFRKSNTDIDFAYWRTVALQGDNTDTLKFTNGDLFDMSYKFLFICTPTEAEIAILNNEGNLLNNDNIWGDVRIRQSAEKLSKDNYYQVIEKTGEELSELTQIHATLARIVGQIVFDIYRIDTDISNPTSIVSTDVASVLDRVYQIDIEYTNMSKEFYFSESNDLLVNEVVNQSQLIEPVLNDNLTLSLPQQDQHLELYNEAILGAVRIKGLYGLPSEGNLSVKLTFHYYDDTPACGNIDDTHTHSAECFVTKTLELNIPQNNPSMQYLKLLPNTYTVNKAGIKYDRIIDLSVPGSFGFNTEWANEE